MGKNSIDQIKTGHTPGRIKTEKQGRTVIGPDQFYRGQFTVAILRQIPFVQWIWMIKMEQPNDTVCITWKPRKKRKIKHKISNTIEVLEEKWNINKDLLRFKVFSEASENQPFSNKTGRLSLTATYTEIRRGVLDSFRLIEALGDRTLDPRAQF